jgi:hypothetical protein
VDAAAQPSQPCCQRRLRRQDVSGHALMRAFILVERKLQVLDLSVVHSPTSLYSKDCCAAADKPRAQSTRSCLQMQQGLLHMRR